MDAKQMEEGFLSKNIINVIGDIDSGKMSYVERTIAQLYLNGSPDIMVIISSGGGSVRGALGIYDLLALYPGRKTAIVYDMACSMAAIIVQACNERLITANAKVLVHNISREIKLDVIRDEKKLKAEIADMEKVQNQIYDIVVKRSGKSLDEVKIQFGKDEFLRSEECIVFGLLDGIWDKQLPK